MKKNVLFLLLVLSVATIQAQTFTVENHDFIGLSRGAAIWGDVDDDGYLDVLITGTSETGLDILLYKSNEGKSFQYVKLEGVAGVYDGDAAFLDYNNDGNLDFIVVGAGVQDKEVCILYENNGNMTFTAKDFKFIGMRNASVACGDFNNDGWVDIAVGGITKEKQSRTVVYENLQGKGFRLREFGLAGINDGELAWVDFNVDGLLDLAITGNGNTNLYKNVEDGFEDINAQLPGLYKSTFAFGDYNNDGYPDMALTGSIDMSPSGLFGMIYLNAGGTTMVEDFEFQGVWNGACLTWGDFDNDDFTDLLIIGDRGVQIRTFYILHNLSTTQTTEFKEVHNPHFPKIDLASASWGDMDRNGMLDILYCGRITGARSTASVLANNLRTLPYIPEPPTTLKSYQNGNNVILTWLPLVDTLAYTYNLRVGTESESNNVLNSMTTSHNKLKRPSSGNVKDAYVYTLKKLTPKQTYHWSVQAVPKNYMTTNFSQEMTFTMVEGLPEITSLKMIQNENMIELTALVSSLAGVTEVGFLYAFSREELFSNPKVLQAKQGQIHGIITTQTPILRDYDYYHAIPYAKTANGTSYGLPMFFFYPQPPVAKTPIMYCQGERARPLTAEGDDLKWYSSTSLYTPLNGIPVPNTNVEGRHYFWVTQSVDGEESDRAQVIVHVAASEPNYFLDNTMTFDSKQSVFFLPANKYVGAYEWQLPEGWIGESSANSIKVNFVNGNPNGKITVIARNGCGESVPVEMDITQTETSATIKYNSRTDLARERAKKKK